jgi:hypothetical protein
LAVEIEASSVGHDLARGVASFQRPRRPAVENGAADHGPANGHGAEAGLSGGPVAEAGLDGAGEAAAALDGRNGTEPGLAALNGSGEPAGLSAPF